MWPPPGGAAGRPRPAVRSQRAPRRGAADVEHCTAVASRRPRPNGC